jgi:hypothetical protein
LNAGDAVRSVIDQLMATPQTPAVSPAGSPGATPAAAPSAPKTAQ